MKMTVLGARWRRFLAVPCLVALMLPLLGIDASPPSWPESGSGPAQPAPGRAPAIAWNPTADEIRDRCAGALRSARLDAEAIVRVPAKRRSFSAVIVPLENVIADLNDRLAAEMLAATAGGDKAVRDAAQGCQKDTSDFEAALLAEPDLYAAVRAASGVDADGVADRKLAEFWLTSLKRAGAALAASQQREFVALSQRLNAVQQQFGRNIDEDRTTITLNGPQLAGLPGDLVATFSRDGGAYVVPVNYRTAMRFMRNADDESARKTFFFAIGNRAVPANLELLREARRLRQALARLLGYRSWAAFVLADRMAGTPARVTRFLSDVDRRALPMARRELAELASLKARQLNRRTTALEAWDVEYYDNRLLKERFALDDDELRAYFPIEHVEHAVFDLYSKLLGVKITQRLPASTWHPDVSEWAVSDAETGRYIGEFYLDLYSREGKYSLVASLPLLPARRLADGGVRPPADVVFANWTKAPGGKPTLLALEDVGTLVHEMGHAMATLLTEAPYESLSDGYRWDFIEVPSELFENWVWDPQFLRRLSANVATGAPLPDELIAKIQAARRADMTSPFDAYSVVRQVMLSQINVAYHTCDCGDTTEIWRRTAARSTPLAAPKGVHPEASFEHLMAGYDVGYYSYLWSRVYAQDLFSEFAAGGLENPAIGARFRRDILAPGREFEPDQEVTQFLGRPMSPDAFYSAFGIKAVPRT